MFELLNNFRKSNIIFLITNATEHGRMSLLLTFTAIVVFTNTGLSYNIPHNIVSAIAAYIFIPLLLGTLYFFSYKISRKMLLKDDLHYISLILKKNIIDISEVELKFFYHYEIYKLEAEQEIDIYYLKIQELIQDSQLHNDFVFSDYIDFISNKKKKNSLEVKILLQLNIKKEKKERAFSIIRTC